jgi:hypothetical protein
MTVRSKPLIVMFAISLIAFLAIAAVDFLTPEPPEEQLRRLRQGMLALRASADSCQAALAREEAGLRASDARFDSLKNAIDFYESLDPRGVPADSYEAYLETFRAYNEGIPERAAAGDSLQLHWQTCSEIVAQHNAIADSARAIAEGLGLIRGSSDRQPGR